VAERVGRYFDETSQTADGAEPLPGQANSAEMLRKSGVHDERHRLNRPNVRADSRTACGAAIAMINRP